MWRPSLAGLFVSILILSLVFASRLRPASRAPLLFRPDTNIQVLLDLKYNLSAEGISCITCSGEGCPLGVPCGVSKRVSLKDVFPHFVKQMRPGCRLPGPGETAIGRASFLRSGHSSRC